MVKFNQKSIGLLLIGFAIILIVILSFIKAGVDRQGAFLCEAVSSNPNLDMAQCPAHESTVSWLIFIAFGLSFLILGAGIYMVFMPVKKEEEFKKIDVSKLSEEERKIYEMLKENEGSMYQSDIIKETGLSKVNITRILDKMESKKIIDRKRRGMTNIVILK